MAHGMAYRTTTSSRRIWIVASLIVACSGVARAELIPEAFERSTQGDLGRESLHSLDLLLSLSLTPQQVRAILPIHAEACGIYIDAYRQRAEIQPQEIEAYTAFLAEDRLNQGFSPEVERATQKIHRRAIETRESVTAELNNLAENVWNILSPGQRRVASYYTPGTKAVFATFATPKERRKAWKRERAIAKERYKSARRARQRGKRPPVDRSRDPQLARARQQLDAINKAVHPRPDIIAKYVLTPAASETLYRYAGVKAPQIVRDAVTCWRYGLREYPRNRCTFDEQRLHALRKEINNWNLVNGMHFSQQQIHQLVHLASRRERLTVSQRTARRKYRMHPNTLNATLVQFEIAAESVLRPGQVEVLEEYKPCLIPPKNLKDPVRVGQANDSVRLAGWLERTRNAGEKRRGRMVDRLIEMEAKHLGPMDDSTKRRRKALLRAVASRAADMDDIEFALSKDELAEKIAPDDPKKRLTSEIDAMRRTRFQPGRTSRFLLNREFASVLTQRYAQLSRPPQTAKADLANGPKADDCVKGCAARRTGRTAGKSK